MTSLAHESVAAARSEIEAVARRLLALRSEIDEILVGLVRPPPAPAGQAESAGEPVEEPMTASATQTTDAPDAVEDRAVQQCALDDECQNEQPAAVEPRPCEAVAPEACTPGCIPLAPSDLTLISAIDEALSDRLNSLGIAAFSQIAHWSRQDVARVSEALDLDRRICKENWIEQAAILASGEMTLFASRRFDQARTPVVDAEPAAAQPAPVAEVAPAPEAQTLAVVLSLDPYRGIPRVPPAIRKGSPPVARGRIALAVKLAASLVALVLAGLVMVDRDAWGSVPARKKPAPALQAQASPSVRSIGESERLQGVFAMEGFMPWDRQ
jgi:predicted flap endonuclease-1-like 5' DNA nuclease